MGPAFSAYVYIIASIFMGSAICYLCFGGKVVFKMAVGWSILITVSMFGNMLLLVATTILFFLSVKDEASEVKVLYFVALLPVMPIDPYMIPFPGLSFLWDLKYVRLLVLLFLFPLFFIFINRLVQQGPLFRLSDIFFLVFFLINVFVLVRLGNPTNIVRAAFSMLIDYAVPYFVVSRFLLTPMGLNWLLTLFLIGASYLTFVSIFESLLSWRIYGD